MTAIEWTDVTWNPIVGCSRVSKGCERCYAERFVHRGMAPQHRGLTVLGQHGPRWTGEVRLVEGRLGGPLTWRKPRRVFVNSLSDLFHDGLSNDAIAAVFGVMAACPHLTFQVLTKRPARMRRWFAWAAEVATTFQPLGTAYACASISTNGYHSSALTGRRGGWPHAPHCVPWPLPNVWLGVTAEDQQRADERIPILLDTPAAVRWVSYEPALGPVDFRDGWLGHGHCPTHEFPGGFCHGPCRDRRYGLDWIVVGGESGPGARPFDLTWARATIKQCRAAGVSVFFKQAGRFVVSRNVQDWIGHRGSIEATGNGLEERMRICLDDRKGADLAELPADLGVREFPPEVRP